MELFTLLFRKLCTEPIRKNASIFPMVISSVFILSISCNQTKNVENEVQTAAEITLAFRKITVGLKRGSYLCRTLYLIHMLS